MPYVGAELLHARKLLDKAGGIEEWKIWKVPRDARHPDGIRYRLAYIPAGHKIPAVLYDNHHPKGHHKHLGSHQFSYEFSGLGRLLIDFKRDIKALQ